MNEQKVEISTLPFSDSCYTRGKQHWEAKTLYKQVEAEKLCKFDIPLASINLTDLPFSLNNLKEFIFQVKRTKNCDKTIPIILDDFGQIADGYHRVCRAILDGDKSIKGYRLNKMPKEDFSTNEE